MKYMKNHSVTVDKLLNMSILIDKQAKSDEFADQVVGENLLSELSSFRKLIAQSVNSNDIEKAAILLSHFCIDSLDWDSQIFKRCQELTDATFSLSKKHDQAEAEKF